MKKIILLILLTGCSTSQTVSLNDLEGGGQVHELHWNCLKNDFRKETSEIKEIQYPKACFGPEGLTLASYCRQSAVESQQSCFTQCYIIDARLKESCQIECKDKHDRTHYKCTSDMKGKL